MRVTLILSLFREDIIRALFWTLVHSLWQGLALAMFTGLVILLTRRSTPVLRYNILLGLFSLFIAGAGTTFFLQLRGVGSGGPGLVQTGVLAAVETPIKSGLLTSGELSWSDKMVSYFNQRAELIVAVWMIFLLIRLVKLLVSLGNVQRLRYYRTSLADEQWQMRVRELAQRLGIKRAVVLLQSALIPVPMMAGIFKPVILVPLGMLSQLPPQQVEAILLHELAHIRRKDYVINLLQSVAEILFFFNPAVLWISSLIREERENCCDDIAVSEASSKKEFINALVSFQEYTQSPSYALAFPGSKNQLLERVKRIVHQDNKRLNLREKLFLLVCVFITAGFIIAYARRAPETLRKMGQEITVQALSAGGAEFVATSEGADTSKPVETVKPVEMVKANAAVVDTAIRPEQRREWERTRQQQQAVLAGQQKRLEEAEMRLAVQQKELAAQQERLNELYADALARTQELRDSVHGRIPSGHPKEQLAELRLLENKHLLEKQARLMAEDLWNKRVLLEDESRRQELVLKNKRFELHEETGRRMNEHVAPIIALLLDRKIISQRDELSFSLDKDGFVVNGERQSQEVFKLFKEQFLKDPQDYVRYSRKGGSESTSVSRHKD